VARSWVSQNSHSISTAINSGKALSEPKFPFYINCYQQWQGVEWAKIPILYQLLSTVVRRWVSQNSHSISTAINSGKELSELNSHSISTAINSDKELSEPKFPFCINCCQQWQAVEWAKIPILYQLLSTVARRWVSQNSHSISTAVNSGKELSEPKFPFFINCCQQWQGVKWAKIPILYKLMSKVARSWVSQNSHSTEDAGTNIPKFSTFKIISMAIASHVEGLRTITSNHIMVGVFPPSYYLSHRTNAQERAWPLPS
jgi:hypothetical protein